MLQIRSVTQVNELSNTWLGDDMKRTCCLSCTQSGLFDPRTDAQSGLKWTAVSVKCLYVLWPAVLVSQLICLLSTWPRRYRRIVQLDWLELLFSLLWEQNHMCGVKRPHRWKRRPSWHDQIIRPTSISVRLEKSKSSHRPSAEFILASLLPEGTSICTSAVPQSISAWTNMGEILSARSYLCGRTHLCVC